MEIPTYNKDGSLTDYGKSLGLQPVQRIEIPGLQMMKGDKGVKGDTGDVGPEGKQGESIVGPQGPAGKNGRDGARGPAGENGKNGADGLPGMPGKDAIEKTPEEIRDGLESLKKGKKLSIQAIEDLAGILEELKKERKGGGRDLGLLKGGIHAGKGKEIRFIDDETPSGTINGSNTDFTTSKTPISGSLKVYRGGARQRVTEDYTFSGKTITFTIAPQVGEIILVDYRY